MLTVLAACESDSFGVATGAEGGPCFDNLTCKAGLSCDLSTKLCRADAGGKDGSVDAPSGDGGENPQRIFATSSLLYTGDFKGLGGADAMCEGLAKAANLGSRKWLAVLSSGTLDAKDHVKVTGRIVNMQGESIATNAADLWDGALTNPIRYDERGKVVSGPTWSATNADGTSAVGEACKGWIDQSNAPVLMGNALTSDSKWIAAAPGACSERASLYCLEQ